MNTEQERTEFEAWYRLHHGSRDVYERDVFGEYVDKQAQGAFNVWQARAALTAETVCEAEYEAECRAVEASIRATMLSGRSTAFHELEIGEYGGEDTLLSAILRASVSGQDVKALTAALVRLVIDNRTKGI